MLLMVFGGHIVKEILRSEKDNFLISCLCIMRFVNIKILTKVKTTTARLCGKEVMN